MKGKKEKKIYGSKGFLYILNIHVYNILNMYTNLSIKKKLISVLQHAIRENTTEKYLNNLF